MVPATPTTPAPHDRSILESGDRDRAPAVCGRPACGRVRAVAASGLSVQQLLRVYKIGAATATPSQQFLGGLLVASLRVASSRPWHCERAFEFTVSGGAAGLDCAAKGGVGRAGVGSARLGTRDGKKSSLRLDPPRPGRGPTASPCAAKLASNRQVVGAPTPCDEALVGAQRRSPVHPQSPIGPSGLCSFLPDWVLGTLTFSRPAIM